MTRPDKIARVWHRWSWLCHILGLAFLGGIIWQGIQDTQAQVIEQGKRITAVEQNFNEVSQDTRVMKESLRWIEKRLGR